MRNGYDLYGKLKTLKTWRDASGSPDVTTWNYDSSTGLLISKRDASDKGATYAYTPDGKLLTRTWARGVSTMYSHYLVTGELKKANYSDSTPDVSHTYNRMGKQKSVTDAAGSRVFNYSADLQLNSESVSGIYNNVMKRDYLMLRFKGRYLRATSHRMWCFEPIKLGLL